MNKNFEEAYQAEVQLNIPDLWNRIESSLPEKTVVKECAAAEPAADFAPVNQAANENKDIKKTKKKNPYAWIKWASLAAAGLLVVIMIPAVVGLGLFGLVGKGMASTDSAANEMYVTQDAVMENAAEMDMMDGAAMESPDMDYMEEVFVESEDEVTVESEAETVPVPEEEGIKQDTQNESVGSASGSVALYGDTIAEDIPATVTGIMTGSDRDYYRVTLMFEEDALETAEKLFTGLEEYNAGMLEVRIYYDVTSEPELAENYMCAIYEITPAALGEEDLYPHLAAELQVLE